MKKIRLLAVLALLVLPFVQISAQERKLVLYTFEEMFPQSVLDDFKRDKGITVEIVAFDLNEDIYNALEGGDVCGLAIADDYIVDSLISNGLAQKLNRSKIRNYANINPFFQHQFYDKNDEYTIPYGAGIQTIVYDPAKVGNMVITGYTDLWNSRFKGSLGIIGNYRVVNGMALKVLGHSYNTESDSDITAAGRRLTALAPNIRLIQDINLDEALCNGEISAAVMYTSEVTKAKMRKPELKVVFPKEGIGFGIMAALIPSSASAADADAAHQFLDYILDPQRGARCFEELGYYCTFLASERYIKREFLPYITLPRAEEPGSAKNSGYLPTYKYMDFEFIESISNEVDRKHHEIWIDFNVAIGR
ncbi:spermidine/putrescine ABC transporter substrate-binding protein [Spirochaetia bacterium]|nr:spermidine/putrescine ABC transporter substrate-binding protein [Spirochaetia bacterium]